MFNLIQLNLMETSNVIRLTREFEASIIYVKHEFDCSRIQSEISRGFRAAALTSGLRQKELEKITSDDVLTYFKNAAKAFAIVSSLNALDQSPKLGVRPLVIELGYNDIRKQLWDKVLQQFKVPSGIVELFRLSYSPVIMQDGTIILSVTPDELVADPKSFIFTSFSEVNIAKVYSSGLATSTRTNVFDAIPMVYQHITKEYSVPAVLHDRYKFSVDTSRVEKAVANYVKAMLKGAKLTGDALKVRDVLSDHDIDFNSLEDKTQLSQLVSYDWFEHVFYTSESYQEVVTPEKVVPSSLIESDLFLPEGYEDLISSGQIFGALSRISNIYERAMSEHVFDDDLTEIQLTKVVGGVNLEDESDIPAIVDKSLLRYSVKRYDWNVVSDWWFKTCSESK